MPERSGIATTLTGLPVKRGEGRPGIGAGIDPHAEPGHAVGAEDPKDRAEEDDDDVPEGRVLQPAEIVGHADGDENPQDNKELALLGEIGFAGLPDDVGHIEHRAVGGQVLRLVRLDESEEKAQNTDDQTEIHDMYAVQRGAEPR